MYSDAHECYLYVIFLERFMSTWKQKNLFSIRVLHPGSIFGGEQLVFLGFQKLKGRLW